MRILSIVTLMLALMAVPSCSGGDEQPLTDTTTPADTAATESTVSSETTEAAKTPAAENVFYAHIGETTLEIEAADNSSAEAFMALLGAGELTVEMSDYGNFEKVGSIGSTLVTNDERITTEPGDVILYQGSSITIYYDTNTWTFTRLGRVVGVTRDELKAILGENDVSVTFALE